MLKPLPLGMYVHFSSVSFLYFYKRSTFPDIKWKSLNPIELVEHIYEFYPSMNEKLMGLLNEV